MNRQSLSIVFFGTAEFAVPCLEALLQAGHRVLAVVTQPDKEQGRGRQLAASPVKLAALRLGLPVLQPRRVRSQSFIASIREMAPDVLALAAFGQIVPQALLDIPPLGPINVHGSLLPKYRGAAPIQRAIMAGETETGVTTMWMDATLDTGDMLLSEAIPIEPEDNAGTMFPKLAEVGSRLLVATLDGLANGTLVRRKQDNSQATLAPAIQPGDAEISWTEGATQIHNLIRGVTPKPGAFTSVRDKRVKIWSSIPMEASESQLAPGTIVRINKKPQGLLVACGDNTALLVLEAQPESGKRMSAADWARGLHIDPGESFGPPTQ